MKNTLRALALLLVVITAAAWFALGGTLGWSQTQIPQRRVDPVTGIDFVEYRAGFVPGVEFLAAGVGGAILLFAATLFVRITPKPTAP